MYHAVRSKICKQCFINVLSLLTMHLEITCKVYLRELLDKDSAKEDRFPNAASTTHTTDKSAKTTRPAGNKSQLPGHNALLFPYVLRDIR